MSVHGFNSFDVWLNASGRHPEPPPEVDTDVR